jgi:sterol desaturase/sphingolipid hydroxylase (fatty acid hydroxylase superfamily)
MSPVSGKSLAVVFLLMACFLITSTTAAQEEELEVSPAWANALSLSASVFAIACSATAVVELSIYPKTFWMLNGLAALLLFVSYSVTGFKGVSFWITTFSVVIVVIIVTAVMFTKGIVGKLVRR